MWHNKNNAYYGDNLLWFNLVNLTWNWFYVYSNGSVVISSMYCLEAVLCCLLNSNTAHNSVYHSYDTRSQVVSCCGQQRLYVFCIIILNFLSASLININYCWGVCSRWRSFVSPQAIRKGLLYFHCWLLTAIGVL